MNSHNTHSAHSTNNAPNSSSSSTALSFKIYSALPYLLVIALSSILCFGFCRFVVDKEIENDISVTTLISESMMMADNLIEKNLQCATEALNVYMQYNPVPKNQDALLALAHKSGVDGFNIFDKNGKRIYASNGGCPYVQINGCKGGIMDSKPSLKNVVLNNIESHNTYPVVFDKDLTMQGKVAGSSRFDIMYMPSKKLLLDSYVGVHQIGVMFKKALSRFTSIKNMKLYNASGVVLIDTCNLNGTCVAKSDNDMIGEFPRSDVYFDDYSEEAMVKSEMSNIKVFLPFGGLLDSEGYTKSGGSQIYAGQTNDAGQYFYVMNVTFDKTELNKQLAMITVGFIVFALIACIAIYYINKSITQSNHLSDLSERTADKVTHLCNTRLGEVRRYVTKIVGDSMRTKNMNKELPEEMVELLDRAFREVDERDLIAKKSKDVE